MIVDDVTLAITATQSQFLLHNEQPVEHFRTGGGGGGPDAAPLAEDRGVPAAEACDGVDCCTCVAAALAVAARTAACVLAADFDHPYGPEGLRVLLLIGTLVTCDCTPVLGSVETEDVFDGSSRASSSDKPTSPLNP